MLPPLSREGGTPLHLPPPAAERGPGRRAPVFYNAAMCLDRDLGVAFARAWARRVGLGRSGWEMLAATGVRGLRVAHESDLFASLVLTESRPEALEVLRANVARCAAQGVSVRAHDARTRLSDGPFDVVDLDPFGTPEPFLDAALGALAPGGLIGVTATDMMVLAGVVPGACERRYGARPVRGRLGPEGGLRILLAHLARRSATLGRHVVPRLAYVHDHHVRLYATVDDGPAVPAAPIGPIDPSAWDGPTLAGAPPFGPMWLGPLFDRELVSGLQVPETAARPKELARWLEAFRAEVDADRPFYYEPNELARELGLARPPSRARLLEGLRSRGFAAGATHARPGAFRTTAPRPVVHEIARETAR